MEPVPIGQTCLSVCRTDPDPFGVIRGQPPKLAMFGVKLKPLKKSGTLYDLNGSHSPPVSSQASNGDRPDPGPHWGQS